jgi:adenylosuccinate synthase
MADLLDERLFREKLEINLAQKNRLLRDVYDTATFSVDEILNPYMRYAGWLAPYITDTALLLSRWIDAGYDVLFEAAQATMLDIDHGTYPYISSSTATAGGASTGSGVPPTKLHGILGVAKAYTTRVGDGPFPTELTGQVGELLRSRGNEYGSTTGRPRRCGWLDAVVLRYAVRINGIETIALTKLDVLDGLETIEICTGYKIGDRTVTEFPSDLNTAGTITPIYESWPGWTTPTKGAREYDQLPAAAQKYVKRLEEVSGVPVGLISTGSDRMETIIRNDSVVADWLPKRVKG